MYNYQEIKSDVFLEENQEMFLKIREKTFELLKESGAVTLGNIINNFVGDSWTQMACVDRLVELKEIKEIKQINIMSQNKIYVKT